MDRDLDSGSTKPTDAAETVKADRLTDQPADSHDPSRLSAEEQERRFRDFAEAASEWFWEMDENLRFCWFSDRFEEIAGVSPDYLLGKSRRDLLNANDPVTDDITSLQDWWNHVADLEAHRPFKSFIHPRVHPDGHKVYLSISGKPVHDDDGNFTGYRGIGADITDRITIEKSLRSALVDAEAANRAKSEFLATMSHELRTPLNVIIGFSDIIRQELNGPIGSESYLSYAEDIHSSGQQLLGVINDILDMARSEAELMPVNQMWIPLSDLMQDVQRRCGPDMRERDVRLEIVRGRQDVEVLVDRRNIGRAIANLISNATNVSAPRERVELGWRLEEDGSVSIQVTDHGPGMTRAEIETAFQPFGLVQHHLTRRSDGAGLGLPLARRLCELHSARLDLASTPGSGLTATVSLPADRVRIDHAAPATPSRPVSRPPG